MNVGDMREIDLFWRELRWRISKLPFPSLRYGVEEIYQ